MCIAHCTCDSQCYGISYIVKQNVEFYFSNGVMLISVKRKNNKYRETQKNGNFWKTQQKLKKSNKKNLLAEIEPLHDY